jgi:serine/threonine protein kinase
MVSRSILYKIWQQHREYSICLEQARVPRSHLPEYIRFLIRRLEGMSIDGNATGCDGIQECNRKDIGAAAHEDESSAFCETMLGLAEFHIREDPSLDQPDQLTLRHFRKIYKVPTNDDDDEVAKFFDHADLRVSEGDPADVPGLANFIRLVFNNKPPKTWNDRENAKRWLLQFQNKECTGDKFAVGQTVGGRWVITSQLTEVKGSCNQGILFVLDKLNGEKCIMKILTSEALDPGRSSREIGILRRLSHYNIISFFDAHLPCTVAERHATPYLVTEYCDKKTLLDVITRCNQNEELIPEDFVWQVFESLVSAVKYLHHGPDNTPPGTWDAVSHRDIIASNILCTLAIPTLPYEFEGCSNQSPYDYPVRIKLADFGCSITDSEMAAQPKPWWSLPAISGDYEPPEGALPTEAADMYQIGLVISLMYCMTNRPYEGIFTAGFLYQTRHPGFAEYTSELRTYLEMCLDSNASQRPKSKFFLPRRQSARRLLSKTGKFDNKVERRFPTNGTGK